MTLMRKSHKICNLTSKAGASWSCFLCILFHSLVKYREMGIEESGLAAKEISQIICNNF